MNECFCNSRVRLSSDSGQSQTERPQHHVQDSGAGEAGGLPADRGHAGRLYVALWAGARRCLRIWYGGKWLHVSLRDAFFAHL